MSTTSSMASGCLADDTIWPMLEVRHNYRVKLSNGQYKGMYGYVCDIVFALPKHIRDLILKVSAELRINSAQIKFAKSPAHRQSPHPPACTSDAAPQQQPQLQPESIKCRRAYLRKRYSSAIKNQKNECLDFINVAKCIYFGFNTTLQ